MSRVRWLWWTCFGAGVVLALLLAMDASGIARYAMVVLALGAHGCLAIFVVALVREARDRERRGDRRLWGSSTGRLAFNTAIFGAGVYVVDQYVKEFHRWWAYLFLAAAGAVFLTAACLALLLFFSGERLTEGRGRVVAEWIVVVSRGLALGMVVVVVGIGVLALRNQHVVDDDPISLDPVAVDFGTYVALGDSYSSGEGLEPFLPGPRPECHRSPFAYPFVLTQMDVRGAKPPITAQLEFRACAGAITSDVDLGIVGGHVPQIDAAPRRDVKLVTMTIGGNDVVFSRVVRYCFLHESCTTAQFDPPETSPARPTVRYPPAAPFDEWARAAIDMLGANVNRVYEDVHAAYPTARILVLGYPYLFPSGKAPWWQGDCFTVLRRVDEDERDDLRNLTDLLNERLYAETDAINHKIGTRSLEFISPASAWNGHEPCGQLGQYTNAVKPTLKLLNPIDGGTFHPNKKGQRQLAKLVTCYLNAFPDGAPPFEMGRPPGSGVAASVADSPDCETLLARADEAPRDQG